MSGEAEQHDVGYIYVCDRDDMWKWSVTPPAPAIKVFSVMESELEVLASPMSWLRRRRIVAAIKRESVSAEDTPEPKAGEK